MRLNISPEALQDLQQTKAYIRDTLQNPIAAGNVISRIIKQLRRLPESPRLGSPLQSIVDIETNYRFLLCGNYAAFYRIEGNEIYVDRVLYGRRDFMRILFGRGFIDEPDEE